ncbi:MAG: amidohydrolase [Bacilli bacterium]|nr:amidohydrolase [Bacilli bacterium]
MTELRMRVREIEQTVVEWRRYLHAHPELSFQEHQTAEFVAGTLRQFGIEVTRPTPTSVVGIVRGKQAGRVLALRADMDALPIHELNEFEFKSNNPGVMHACGHDGHTAILLGAARLLTGLTEHWRGEIRFIFQHGEELHPGGAGELVRAGVLNGVDLVLGNHLWAPLETGQIGLVYGPAMASPDCFTVQIQGRGGHAAAPHETVDAIQIGAGLVTALHQIVSRQVDPLVPAVISVCEFHAGSAHNIIADTARLVGTVRTFDKQLREEMPIKMEKIIQGICTGFGATYEFDYEYGYDPVVNNEEATRLMEEVVVEQLGAQAVNHMNPVMGGEDFSAYQAAVPGCFFFTGAGNSDKGAAYPHHHPRFTIDEDALADGMQLFTAAALKFLA